MAIELCPLFALEKQFQAKNGANNTNGFLMVFLAGTDDPVITYSDYVGTRNPQRIVLDDNGRAVVICDKAKAYRLEVYDADGMLLWTEEPVYCSGTGGGGISVTEVISTDGSITVDKSTAGSVTTYDISIAPSDSDEFLEWIKCSEEDCGSTWYPVYQSGTMETEAGQGIKVHGGHLYHFTNTFYVDPDGTGITYSTFQVNMYCNGEVVDSRNFDIDTSVNDSVQCEFSTDVIPEADGYVYFTLTIPSGCEVTGEVQCHRIYSGINAVPDTCATKQWVEQNISSKISYSALEYNNQNLITGISGSAIAANSVDPNEFIPWSASGTFQPSGDYLTATASSLFQPSGDYLTATASSLFQPSGNYVYESAFSSYSSVIDNSITAISSVVSGVSSTYIEKSASGMFQPSGDYVSSTEMSAYAKASSLEDYQLKSAMSAYAYESSLSSKLDSSAFSAVSGTFLTAVPEGYATESYVDSAVSSKLDVTASSQFLTSLPEDLAYTSDVASAVSGKMDKSESSSFYPMDSNPAGYLTAHQSLAGYATEQYVDSAVSSKLDTSAYDSAWFQPASSMSAWIPYSALDYSGTAISGIGGSSLAGMGGGADYSGVAPVNVDNDTRLISVDHRTLCVDDSLSAYNSGNSAVVGVKEAWLSSVINEVISGYIPYSALGHVEI